MASRSSWSIICSNLFQTLLQKCVKMVNGLRDCVLRFRVARDLEYQSREASAIADENPFAEAGDEHGGLNLYGVLLRENVLYQIFTVRVGRRRLHLYAKVVSYQSIGGTASPSIVCSYEPDFRNLFA